MLATGLEGQRQLAESKLDGQRAQLSCGSIARGTRACARRVAGRRAREAHMYPWRTAEERRATRSSTRFFDAWSDEGTRKVRAGRWQITWTSWATVKTIAATWEAKRAALYAGDARSVAADASGEAVAE
jgi:hypothetical protein